MNITGLHHVTAIASDPQRNLNFYVGLLGLRLIKRTVNFDDPGCYHFYFGDGIGSPGTILTFFPWPDAHRGVRGIGEIETVRFAIPATSLDYWLGRLKERHVDAFQTEERFGEEVIRLADPDGLLIELVATTSEHEIQPWTDGPVPAQHVLRGLHGVLAALERHEETEKLLTESFGYRLSQEAGNRIRLVAPVKRCKTIDLVCLALGRSGSLGAGAVHHIAFRVADDEQQQNVAGKDPRTRI